METTGNLATHRRDFLIAATLAGASLTIGPSGSSLAGGPPDGRAASGDRGYKYRVAFGCWINDMRSEALPLQQWPAPHLDDVTMSSVLAAMDVQARAGFNYLDVWGLFATYGYPPDITGAFDDKDRAARVTRLIEEGSRRGLKFLFGMGLFSWGYDQIIRADPGVRGRDKAGKPMDHVMCGATEKAWGYVEKILDAALSRFDFGGVHLESADLGWCQCPECGGKYGTVGYNVRLNIRAADYIKRKWPGKVVTCIPINWLGGSGRSHFDQAEQDRIIELSRHVNCFMDQGWTGTFIAEDRRKAFIERLHCDYGTSGGLWVYHPGAGSACRTSSRIRGGRPPRSAGTSTTGAGLHVLSGAGDQPRCGAEYRRRRASPQRSPPSRGGHPGGSRRAVLQAQGCRHAEGSGGACSSAPRMPTSAAGTRLGSPLRAGPCRASCS